MMASKISASIQHLLFCAVLIATVNQSSAVPLRSGIMKTGLFDDPHVFLTVSSQTGVDENGEFLNRMLEMNWNNLVLLSGSWIGIFNYDPLESSGVDHFENALQRLSPLEAGTGTLKSDVRFKELDFQAGINTTDDGCIGFWLTFFSEENVPATSNCLKLYPNWMNDLKDTIGETPLTSLMIPGTHNAGAWHIYAGKSDDNNLIIKYLYNQEDPIYAQLMHGVRFFDIRVGHYPGTEEKYYINHDVTRIRPLMTFFSDVKSFVEETNEVVLIDMHRFPVGFEDEGGHEEFIDFIENEIGSLLYLESAGRNPTLNQVRGAGKSIILSYGEYQYSNQHDFLWPSVYHAWGNVNKLEDLELYLNEAMLEFGCRGEFWSAMAELTPTATDIILKPNVGLRGFAEISNLPVTSWFKSEAWYSRTNIVSTDYYLGNNIIEMAVKVNQHAGTCT